MVRLKRAFELRFFRSKVPPFNVFERKIADAFAFERKIGTSKEFSNAQKKHAEMQFIVYSIGCFESYLQGIFKLMIDQDLIPVKQLLKIRKLRNSQLNLEELHIIDKNKVTFSEIVVSEINFQNYAELMSFCDLIDFDNNFDRLMKDSKNIDVGFTKTESDNAVKAWTDHMKKKRRKDFREEKLFATMITRNIYRTSKLSDQRKEILGTVRIAIEMRNKIVHNAAVVKMQYPGFQFAILLALMVFAAILQQVYLDKLQTKSTQDANTPKEPTITKN